MAGLEHDSYHEAVPEPRGFIDPQRRYARQRYAVDTEAAAMQDWVPPPTARASSELEARDDKMNAWAGPEEDNRRPVPDGNSEVVLLDHSGKGSSGGKTPIEPLGDPDIVTWDGPNDPEMATNWPLWRKYMTSLILSLFTFIAPFSALMLTPALDVIGEDINIPSGAQRTLLTSLPLLANGLGPLFWAPIMEKTGRVPIIRGSHIVHIIFNTACGFAQTGPQLMAFRFLSAFGASAPNIIAPGLTAETYPPHIGGTGDTMHAMLPFIGKAGAPIAGAFAAQSEDWRWIFWGTSIFSVFALTTTLLLKETYPPVILERKAKKLREETGNPRLRTEYVDPSMTMQQWMLRKAALPLIMLASFPCVQLPFTYRGFLFGVLTLLISLFERLFQDTYQMDTVSASLNYFSFMAGFVMGLQLSCKVVNASTNYLTKKLNKPHQPEFRVPPQIFTVLLVPLGILLFGWSLENVLHYVVPNIGAFIMSIGFILGFFSLQPYVTDSVGLEYASSAHSIAVLLQSLFEFSFTLLGAPMVDGIGIGLTTTLLALGVISVAVPMPFILWYLGPKLRANKKGIPVPAVKYPV